MMESSTHWMPLLDWGTVYASGSIRAGGRGFPGASPLSVGKRRHQGWRNGYEVGKSQMPGAAGKGDVCDGALHQGCAT